MRVLEIHLEFAKGADEIRYQDEQLVLVPVADGLKISAITTLSTILSVRDEANRPTETYAPETKITPK